MAKPLNIISLDILKTRTKLINKMKELISTKSSILIDNTNLSADDRKKLIDVLNSEGVRSIYTIRAIVIERSAEDSYRSNCYRYYLNYKTDTKFIPDRIYKCIMKQSFDIPDIESEDIDLIESVVPGHPNDQTYYFYYR